METLDIWDMQLVEYGTKVMESRKRFIEEVNEIISDIHYQSDWREGAISLCPTNAGVGER